MDRAGIAERLRGLIGGQNDGDLCAVARRLGVEELSLRLSVDDLSPYPTVDVLAAVVLTYGVDPNWLLTGQYNSASHRNVAEADKDAATQSIRAMIEHRVPGEPEAKRSPELRLLKDA